MTTFEQLWGKRFLAYTTELQRYLRFVFTGHLLFVLVFAIGAFGYTYSEWLKNLPTDFPAALVIGILWAGITTFAAPTTLLKEADVVYFLPIESLLPRYFRAARSWTLLAKIPVVIIGFIVSIPLLHTVVENTTLFYLGCFFLLLISLSQSVQIEFSLHYVYKGKNLLVYRALRFIGLSVQFWFALVGSYWCLLFVALGFAVQGYLKKQADQSPTPLLHLIEVEQGRMMRFYRFANYFTDVPHIKGKIRSRNYLQKILPQSPFSKNHVYSFLLLRIFMRSDDLFRLYIRLTLVALVLFVTVNSLLLLIVSTALLVFATTVQLHYYLKQPGIFRMDELFPVDHATRPVAVRKLVMQLQGLQLLLFAIGLLIARQEFVNVVAVLVCAISVSLLSIQVNKKQPVS